LRDKYPEEGINFSDQVVGEAKKFIVVALLTCLKFYEPCFDNPTATKPYPNFNYFFNLEKP